MHKFDKKYCLKFYHETPSWATIKSCGCNGAYVFVVMARLFVAAVVFCSYVHLWVIEIVGCGLIPVQGHKETEIYKLVK
jgi:hypothetical protein